MIQVFVILNARPIKEIKTILMIKCTKRKWKFNYLDNESSLDF